MAMTNPFENDAFGLMNLTQAINNLPFTPSLLQQLDIFEEGSLSTLDAVVEEENGVIDLIPVSARGSAGTPVSGDKRRVLSFRVPHLAERANIMADEVQGVRSFGSENQAQAIETIVNARLAKIRRQIDYTLESHRMAAIKGSYYDAAGNLVSLYTTFGVAQQTVSLELDVAGTELRQVALTIIEKIEDALGGITPGGFRVLCGKTLWSQLIIHPKIKETYLNTAMAGAMRGDGRQSFEFGGLMWERYRGTAAVTIGDTDAYVVPEGVNGLFLTRYAPADYMETVNTLGLPYYSKSEPLPMNKGVAIEAQSNPLNICTRPASIIKLTNT
jgi:hypothetical protein